MIDELDDVAQFDMDESLAGYTQAMIRDLDQLRSPGEEAITEESIWLQDRLPHIANRMALIKTQPGWWLNLEPISAGMTILRLCQHAGFQIAVLTKGPKKHSNAWAEKLLWCQRHIGEDADVTVTFKKHRVYGKILYDDYPDYMAAWLERRPRGLGIMPVTSKNVNFRHPNVVMYHGPEDLLRIDRAIRAAKHRKSGDPLILE